MTSPVGFAWPPGSEKEFEDIRHDIVKFTTAETFARRAGSGLVKKSGTPQTHNRTLTLLREFLSESMLPRHLFWGGKTYYACRIGLRYLATDGERLKVILRRQYAVANADMLLQRLSL